MRPVSVGTALMMILTWQGAGWAQVGRDVRFVQVELAEVRSGPSDASDFYVTNRLKRGQPVEVLAEMPGGWLAIRPPEGSFSYINTRFLKHMYPNMPTHVVTLSNVKVPVFIGSEVINKKPTIIGCQLEAGAQVISKGAPVADEDGSWMPIEPPVQERRYLRASLVSKSSTPGAEVARASSGGAGEAMRSTFTAPGGGTISSAPSAKEPLSPEQMWQRAQQAERNGQLSEAVRLYATIGAETVNSQPALSAQALQRARYLQEGHRSYEMVGGGLPPVGPGPGSVPGTIRVGTPTYVGGHTPETTLTSRSRERIDGSLSSTGSPPRMPAGSSHTRWVEYRGVLRQGGRTVEGQRTFYLENPLTLAPMLYASEGRGVDLGAHVGKTVRLWGYSCYRGDLRNNYMIATRCEVE